MVKEYFETDRLTDGRISARPTRERKTPGREATLSPPLRVLDPRAPNCIKFPSLMLGLRSWRCATSCRFMPLLLQPTENVYTYTGNLLYGQLALPVQK